MIYFSLETSVTRPKSSDSFNKLGVYKSISRCNLNKNIQKRKHLNKFDTFDSIVFKIKCKREYDLSVFDFMSISLFKLNTEKPSAPDKL